MNIWLEARRVILPKPGRIWFPAPQKDGLKLICVVMEDESPMQFTDTIDLFNYGFSNFQAVNASESDTTYNIQGNGFFMTENDIFGDSEPILSLDKSSYVVLPSDASFEDVTSELDYENVSDGQALSFATAGTISRWAQRRFSSRITFPPMISTRILLPGRHRTPGKLI